MMQTIAAALLAIATTPADVVVVRPPAWESHTIPWQEYRQQQGHTIRALDCSGDAEQLRQQIREIARASEGRLRFIVLAGDAPSINAKPNPSSIPTFYIESKVVHRFGSEPTIPSDLPYADFDDDGIPDAAIGRIPAKTGPELARILTKAIDYELQINPGSFRKRVDVIAGVGGFGLLADTAVQMVTRRLLTDSIPGEYQVSMTYASCNSPYCPNPFEFGKQAIARMNSGSQFWVYLGHGYVDTLDHLRIQDRAVQIMTSDMLDEVRTNGTTPIAIFLACYTGAFDAHVDSIAEKLVKMPDGPVATLAGSRVTMPYGMSIFGAALLDCCFKDRVPTLGELVLEAKRRTMIEAQDAAKSDGRRPMLDGLAKALSPADHDLAAERREHLLLFHILGDPLLRLTHPETMPLDLPKQALAGAPLLVKGKAARAGSLTLELQYCRDRLPEGVRGRSQFNDSATTLNEMTSTYRKANNPCIHRHEIRVVAGDFQIELPLDESLRGQYVVTCHLEGANHWSCGSQKILVRKATAPQDEQSDPTKENQPKQDR
jgi:hypothetical protein